MQCLVDMADFNLGGECGRHSQGRINTLKIVHILEIFEKKTFEFQFSYCDELVTALPRSTESAQNVQTLIQKLQKTPQTVP